MKFKLFHDAGGVGYGKVDERVKPSCMRFFFLMIITIR